MFNIIAIRCYSCYSYNYDEFILDLLAKLNQSCKPNPISQLIEGVWDFKAWLKPTQGEMENHSKYHVFRFTKGSTSKVAVYIINCT